MSQPEPRDLLVEAGAWVAAVTGSVFLLPFYPEESWRQIGPYFSILVAGIIPCYLYLAVMRSLGLYSFSGEDGLRIFLMALFVPGVAMFIMSWIRFAVGT